MASGCWARTEGAPNTSTKVMKIILFITELSPPYRSDLLHHFAIAITAVVVQPTREFRKIELPLHHELHRILKAVVALRVVVQLVFQIIEKFADSLLTRR